MRSQEAGFDKSFSWFTASRLAWFKQVLRSECYPWTLSHKLFGNNLYPEPYSLPVNTTPYKCYVLHLQLCALNNKPKLLTKSPKRSTLEP